MRPKNNQLSDRTKKERRKVIRDISQKYITGEDDIIKKSLAIYSWLTRFMIHECAKQMKDNMKKYGTFFIF